PIVAPPPSRPEFSTNPTDVEFLRARVFAEPLIPIGAGDSDDNAAVARAILAYLDAAQPEQTEPLARFMETHPRSRWQASLLLNVGLIFTEYGYLTRAAHDFRFAWDLAKADTTTYGRAVADRAVGELLALETSLGHADTLQALINEIGTRPVGGRASQQL